MVQVVTIGQSGGCPNLKVSGLPFSRLSLPDPPSCLLEAESPQCHRAVLQGSADCPGYEYLRQQCCSVDVLPEE